MSAKRKTRSATAKMPSIGKTVDDGEPFDEKMPRLVAELNAQFPEPRNRKLLYGRT